MGQRRLARERAVQILYSIDRTGQSLTEALVAYVELQHEKRRVLHHFTVELLEQTLEQLPEIDRMLNEVITHWRPERVAIVDRRGVYLDGDYLMAICALDMLEAKTLKKKTLVTTVMSNLGLDHAIQKHGGKVIRTKVGDRYVVDEMRAEGYNFGGEQSGHHIFLDYSTTGDGVLSALQLLSVMRKNNQRLAELASVLQKLPQVLRNVPVKEKQDLTHLHSVTDTIERVERKLRERGRVLVRYSGTEPLVRIMVEGPKQKECEHFADEIGRAISKELG